MNALRARCYGASRQLRNVAVVLLLLVGTIPTPTANAAGGVVPTCDESHLRSAMAGGGTVTLACSGTITLTSTLDVALPTVLDATGQKVVIDGGGKVALFSADNSSFGVVNLTLQNGYTDLTGAAISAMSVVTATGSTFLNNQSVGDGGAINAFAVVVTNSTFVGNRARLGGAIMAREGIAVTNSTFVNNSGYGTIELDAGSAVFRNTILMAADDLAW